MNKIPNIATISKTVTCDNVVLPGISVEDHCKITGFVAQELLNSMTSSLQSMYPLCSVFLAACHDIGKISPAFQKMIYNNVSGFNVDEHTEFKGVRTDNAKRSNDAFHAKVTQIFFENVLNTRSAIKRNISTIEGMHHGFKPSNAMIPENCEIYGSDAWSVLRHNLFTELKNIFGNDESFSGLDKWNISCMVGGLIIVSDWIASGGRFAELTQESVEKLANEELQKMAKEAVQEAGFTKTSFEQGLSFQQIFGFAPRTIQADFFNCINAPGVYILEAPMGLGKTEAALFAAYKMIEEQKASGIYFALPTQLTSNKIYDRVESFLEKVTEQNSSYVKAKLLHGLSWLEDKTLGEDGDAGKRWFDGSKRGILAPFAVGTVDQALMAVMNVKHQMVRSFGLAGKVVILDEVHSYDAYTGTILNKLIEYLKSVNCTVIVLSATLTAEQKKNILSLPSDTVLSTSYPLITSACDVVNEQESTGGTERDVAISISQNDDEVLEQILVKAEQGEQILWIENTVSEAQAIFKKISARVSGTTIESGLIHSRFIKKQRNEQESKWTSCYGKNNFKERITHGRILVGTQVLEQSLDIDADFLVTRLCPTDMLLQRLGRLWRHTENDMYRPKTAICSAVVLAPDYEDTLSKENCFGLSAYVYSEYVLCRTLEVWKNLASVRLPSDIRNLLESTYIDREENNRLAKLKTELETKKERLENMARIAGSTATGTASDNDASTRYSEVESTNVLLLSYIQITDSACKIKVLGEEEIIEVPRICKNSRLKKHIAKTIIEHCVTVSGKNAPQAEKAIQLFSAYVYTGNFSNLDDDENSPFRIAVVGKDGTLRTVTNNIIEVDTKQFCYTNKLGYQVYKKGGVN